MESVRSLILGKMNKRNKQIISITVIVLITVLVTPLLPAQFWPGWTGFGQDTITTQEELVNGNKRTVTKIITQTKSGKALWDWLELLLVPGFLAWLSYKLGEIEQARATNNLRNEAQQAYFNRMENLLLNKESGISEYDDSLQDVIKIYTVTILRRLQGDKELTDEVLNFLRDSDLLKFALENAILKNIKFDKPDLYKANFKGAILENIQMVEANLFAANLEKAILTNAQLEVAVLTEANLKEAHLERANLKGANLQGADLEGACLEETDLERANLEGAKNMNPEQVRTARNWKNAYYDQEFENLLDIANN
jgi:uncharacterized protein YjbI with pentapeptide repeats